MKHGIAFRKLSRTSSHRGLMLRNLVSSLLQHEQIKTTLPKAKEAARLAEKIITLAKRDTVKATQQAEAFLLLRPGTNLPELLAKHRERYASRPGGYTRIHKYGNREGDHAPHAILELVDGPRDLSFAMAARAVGWESAAKFVSTVKNTQDVGEGTKLRGWTRLAVEKVLKYRGEGAREELEALAKKHAIALVAEPRATLGLRDMDRGVYKSEGAGTKGQRAGERLTGMTTSTAGLGLAQGSLGKKSLPRVSAFWQGGWKQKLGVLAPVPVT